MTMHLAQGLSTLRTSKPKASKITKTQLKKYRDELRDYNKKLKQAHRHDEQLTIEQYIDWVHGRTEKKVPVQYQTANEVKTFNWEPKRPYRETPQYRSADTGVGNALAQPKKEYTGTLVTGIATMHKSNAVPVINQEEAESIAKMRRG